MKRKDLVRHLKDHRCELLREGRSHSVWVNPANRQQSTVPRHREISDYTARSICRQLDVPEP
ncbi:MAG: type II toxin-antitoxin system HicA family toxin [Planctomycetota bacterium]